MSSSWKILLLIVCVPAFLICTEGKPEAILRKIEKPTHPVTRGDLPMWGNCGSAGRVTRVSVETCSSEICFFMPETNYTMSIYYIPGDASVTLEYRGWYYDLEDRYEDFFIVPVSGFVMPGQEYVATNIAHIPRSLATARGYMSLQIWDHSLAHPVACAEFDALITA